MPNTTMHIMPTVVLGYHLIRKAKTEACELTADGGHLCLGSKVIMSPCIGDEGCSCSHGHQGFLCQACTQGYTRSTFTDTCSTCEIRQPWMYIVILLAGADCSAIVYYVLTIMDVAACLDMKG